MKLISLLLAILVSFTTVLASEGSFTKDPTCPGGLYLWGPGEGFTANLYYSDDFGETLNIFVPNAYYDGGLIADATPGYLINHYGIIWLSQNYGATWDPVGSTLYSISTGRYPGEMYTFDWIPERVIKYSINYGGSWDIHYPEGLDVNYFIHTVGINEGEFFVLDSQDGELYRSINFADDFVCISTLPVYGSGYNTRISRGALPGELYFYDGHTGDLFFSADTGYTFEWTHNFPDTSYYITQMQAGTTTGDVFIAMGDGYYTGGGEIFIYYSDDYGYNFTEFHPFSTTVGLPYIHLTALDTTSFPATGGVLEYYIKGRNLGPVPYTGDIWCDVTLPNGSIFGPVLGPVEDLYMGSYWSANRDRELTVPANAPAGTYTLNAYIGEYDPVSPSIDYEDHLSFTKEGALDSGEGFADTNIGGGRTPALQNETTLEAYSNPFNPTVSITFTLAATEQVDLSVYDLLGRKVTTIVSGRQPAGTHAFLWNPAQYASGVYIIRLETPQEALAKRVMVVK
jgi:hypothetical protein